LRRLAQQLDEERAMPANSDDDLKRYRREQEHLFEEIETSRVAADQEALAQKIADTYWNPGVIPGPRGHEPTMNDSDFVYQDALQFFQKRNGKRVDEAVRLAKRVREIFEWDILQSENAKHRNGLK
jgi:hypothetical protein